MLFVGCADRVPAFCANVHAIPGATDSTSIGTSLAIHGKSFGPQKAMLFVGCADRASPIPGATDSTSIGPSLDILSSRSVLEKLCFSSAAPTGCLHSARMCMPSLARQIRLGYAPVSTSCRAVRSSKSYAFRRLRRPDLTHPWRDRFDFDRHQPRRSSRQAQLGVVQSGNEADAS